MRHTDILRKLSWFIVLWVCGVLALGLVAYAIRYAIHV
ncbi:MAG: DUF2474 family protein [Sulfitobacter sp.]